MTHDDFMKRKADEIEKERTRNALLQEKAKTKYWEYVNKTIDDYKKSLETGYIISGEEIKDLQGLFAYL